MKKKQSKSRNQSFNGLFLLLLMFATFGFTSSSFSQSIEVNGTVTDANGMPLPGTSITIKNDPTIEAQTHIDGNF